MQLQERLETLLTEIVQNQLVAGHFSVVPAILKFQNSLPNFVMPHLANACAMVGAVAATMSEEQRDALLAQHLPIAMPGQYALLEQLVQRHLVGSIPQQIYVDEKSVYNAEQYVNLCDIVYDLEHAIKAPEVMIDALLHARSKVVEWQNFVIRTYEQKQ